MKKRYKPRHTGYRPKGLWIVYVITWTMMTAGTVVILRIIRMMLGAL